MKLAVYVLGRNVAVLEGLGNSLARPFAVRS